MLKLRSSLNTSIADLAHFCWVEFLPFFVVELSVEFFNKLGMDEVQKGISNIAIILDNPISTL